MLRGEDYLIIFLAARLSIVIKNAGNNTKLQTIAINKVIETKIPSETVPLKVEAVKMKKPVNKTTAV